MVSKLCYVIMPYGGDDESLKKRYKAIYNAIIKPAAEGKDYTVIREDHEARQGNISANIIKSLAEADLVIADLSQNNWNVAYELGIRHSLSKNGTILLIDDKTPLMFDIQGNKVIKYSYEWYDCIDETQQQISDSISFVESNRTHSDSPVHDIYPSFSVKIVDYLTDNNDKEKAVISSLSQENAKLKEILNNAGLSINDTSARPDIATSFRNAIGRSQFSGEKALITLKEKLNNEEEFVAFLGEALTKGFFTESDFSTIYMLCRKLNNYFVTIAFLEEVVRIYPDNEDFSGRLAREYAKSHENREKAVMTVNKIIGVKRIDGKYFIERKLVSHNLLTSFFEVYILLGKYSEMKEIALLLLENYPKHSSLIKRNLVTAYNGLEDYDIAEDTARELVENDPCSINNYYLYRVYRASDQYIKSYEQIEKCIELEPDDPDYYIYMAGLILDSSCIRTGTGEIARVAKQNAISAAVPFVFSAYEAGFDINKCLAFLQKNSLDDVSRELHALVANGCTSIPRDSNKYDYYPIDSISRN